MQVSWSPIASCSSTAATDESTPPDSPQTTLPAPTWARIAWTACVRNAFIVQSPRQPAMRLAKFSSSRPPSGVCTTSGWNITP